MESLEDVRATAEFDNSILATLTENKGRLSRADLSDRHGKTAKEDELTRPLYASSRFYAALNRLYKAGHIVRETDKREIAITRDGYDSFRRYQRTIKA